MHNHHFFFSSGLLCMEAMGTLLSSPASPCLLFSGLVPREGGSRKGMGWGQQVSFKKGAITQSHQAVCSFTVTQQPQKHACLIYEIKKTLQRTTTCSRERAHCFRRGPLQSSNISDKCKFCKWFPGASQQPVGTSSEEVAKREAGPLQSPEFHQLCGSNCPWTSLCFISNGLEDLTMIIANTSVTIWDGSTVLLTSLIPFLASFTSHNSFCFFLFLICSVCFIKTGE